MYEGAFSEEIEVELLHPTFYGLKIGLTPLTGQIDFVPSEQDY